MRLVVTCTADAPADLAARVAGLVPRLRPEDRIEARLDLCSRPLRPEELAGVVEGAGGRLLATCRRSGPGTPATEAGRLDLLSRAGREGAAAVDLEDDAGAVEAGGAELWRSLHLAAEPSPDEAAAAMARLHGFGSALAKLAAPCSDAASALAWCRAARAVEPARESVVIPMGLPGRGLRLLAARGLSDALYCAEGEPVAAGQPRLEDGGLVERARALEAGDPLLAIVGHPLPATWSPVLHTGLQERGLLVPLPVRSAAAVLPLLDELGVTGAAVTMPHKRELCALVDRLGDRAGRARSLNTLRRTPEGWEGESFDGPGARAALAEACDLAAATVAILGAGGAAAALASELATLGGRVVLLARREEQARALADELGVEHAPLGELGTLRADAVVNATPAEPAEPLASRVAFDMRTTPHDTHWLRTARARGLRTVDGLAMLGRQAAAQRRWWGLDGSGDEEVEAALRRLVASRRGRAE